MSHTYEGFLDISLSLKGDLRRPRKVGGPDEQSHAKTQQRDRLMAMAQRFRPGKPSSSDAHPSSSAYKRSDAAISDTELSETEPKESARRASMDKDYRPGEGLNRSSSTKGFALKTKTSFSFRRKGSKSSSATPSIQPAPDQEKISPAINGHAISSATSAAPNLRSPPIHTGNVPTPTSAQSAYIQRVLGGPRESTI